VTTTLPLLCAAAALAALGTTFLTLPVWTAWCLRAGLVDEPGGRKRHAQPAALAGGLAVLTGLLAPLLPVALILALAPGGIAGDPRTLAPLRDALRSQAADLSTCLAGALGLFLVGLIDDWRELKPAPKLAGQCLAACVAAAGPRIPLLASAPAVNWLVTVFWILAVVNAFNLVDNMNGLCAGLGAIGALYCAVIAAETARYPALLIAALACGSLLGFLPRNYPRATAFLGDSGSHLAGCLLAILPILSILPAQGPAAPPAPPAALLRALAIVGVPLADVAWIILFRWRAGQPLSVGDTNHLSHRLTRAGLSPARAVFVLWIAGALLGASALL
jgi:UDP-GlcNAc:undecaprenyl-phosphate GlcNAc-1-phosphate transferase